MSIEQENRIIEAVERMNKLHVAYLHEYERVEVLASNLAAANAGIERLRNENEQLLASYAIAIRAAGLQGCAFVIAFILSFRSR